MRDGPHVPHKATEPLAMHIYNFTPGPAALPEQVLVNSAKAISGRPISVLELSHRSNDFSTIITDATTRLRYYLKVPTDFEIMWFGGGANQQFAVIPMNYAGRMERGSEYVLEYVVTGTWSDRAYREAVALGLNVHLVHDGTSSCNEVKPPSEWRWYPERSRVLFTYYCANETVNGVAFRKGFPELPANQSSDEIGQGGSLVGDWSSNLLTSEIPNWDKHHIVFACAQKNLGIAGLTVVIARSSLISAPKAGDPVLPIAKIFDFKTLADSKSLYNTPPTFAIYVSREYLRWMESEDTLEGFERRTRSKSSTLYKTIDESPLFHCPVKEKDRSLVNVVFRIGKSLDEADEELEKLFLSEATQEGLLNLKGHRSVGGIRASLYNAMPLSGAVALADFMDRFQVKYGDRL